MAGLKVAREWAEFTMAQATWKVPLALCSVTLGTHTPAEPATSAHHPQNIYITHNHWRASPKATVADSASKAILKLMSCLKADFIHLPNYYLHLRSLFHFLAPQTFSNMPRSINFKCKAFNEKPTWEATTVQRMRIRSVHETLLLSVPYRSTIVRFSLYQIEICFF